MGSRGSFAAGALLVAAYLVALPALAVAQDLDFTSQGERPLAVQRRLPPPEVAKPPADAEPAKDADIEDAQSGKKPKSAASVALRDRAGEPSEPSAIRAASRAGEPRVAASEKRGMRKGPRKVRVATVDCEVLALISHLRVYRR